MLFFSAAFGVKTHKELELQPIKGGTMMDVEEEEETKVSSGSSLETRGFYLKEIRGFFLREIRGFFLREIRGFSSEKSEGVSLRKSEGVSSGRNPRVFP